jgi:polysaccharide biosynthesis transport protein
MPKEQDLKTSMELIDYLAIIRRWSWLLILGFIVGSLIGVLICLFQPPIYQASTRILVMRPPQEQVTDYTYLTDQQSVDTYIQLATTQPVLAAASAKLGFSIDPKQISVQQVLATQTIKLTVQDGDAKRAADIANKLVQALIAQNQVIQAGRYASTQQNIQAQIKEVQAQIAQTQSQIGKSASAGSTTSSQLQSTLQLYQQTDTNLLNNLEDIRLAQLQNTPDIVQIESAAVPTSPLWPRPVIDIGLSAIFGLLLAGGVGFLIDYFDDKIRTPEDIEHILGLPVLGYIRDMRNLRNQVDDLHVLHYPRTPVAEAYRSLRTNLEFTNVDGPLTKILITSPGPAEGKTSVSINLAAIIAQEGKRVLLIDADLRRPRIHSILKISNQVGLTTLFRGRLPLSSVMRQLIGSPGFYVITSGKPPPNPTELLASARMNQILEEASRQVDIIILDSPPSLVADSQVLATKVDGVLLVIQPRSTHADIALAALEQLNLVKARTLGVVLNRIPNDIQSYGGYYHHYPSYKYGGNYYTQEEIPQLNAESQPLELPPYSQSQDLHVESNEATEQFHNSEQLRDHVNIYVPSEPAPASYNVITQPRKPMDEYQPVYIKAAKGQQPARTEFITWYLGQDDEQDTDVK